MSRTTLLGMWAVNLARRSFKQSGASAACVSYAFARERDGTEGQSSVLRSLLGVGSFGSVLLGGYLWGGFALCEQENRASAGQTTVSSWSRQCVPRISALLLQLSLYTGRYRRPLASNRHTAERMWPNTAPETLVCGSHTRTACTMSQVHLWHHPPGL